MSRESWDAYFMRLALMVSSRSTCIRRSVGAVITVDRHIVTTGYNGAPAGVRHCSEAGCIRSEQQVPSGERHELCRGAHAEQNAISQAARHGIRVEGGMIYCTDMPCAMCAKSLINAGILRVIYLRHYRDELSERLMTAAGVEFGQFDLMEQS